MFQRVRADPLERLKTTIVEQPHTGQGHLGFGDHFSQITEAEDDVNTIKL